MTTAENTCPTCGKSGFSSYQYVRIHHSKVHGERIPETMDCEVCGGEFEILPSQRDQRRTCSIECKSELHEKEGAFIGENNPAWKPKVQKECRWCEGLFEVRPSRIDRLHFCSDTCRSNWRSEWASGESSPVWNGGQETLACEYCEAKFEMKQSIAPSARFCSLRCRADWQSENQSGENSPHWKGGHAKNYGDTWNRHRRIIAEYYDGCQSCGGDGKDVHHIVPYKTFDSDVEANQLTNLIYLCRDCHAKIEVGEMKCPRPDALKDILIGVNEICHETCVQHAENPMQVIDEIETFEPD